MTVFSRWCKILVLCVAFIATLGASTHTLFAQVAPNTATGARNPADTGKGPKVKQLRPGFDLPDSLYIARDSIRGDIDTIVRYTAKDSTVFDVARKRMTLVNNATIEFENRKLEAHTIVMDFEGNTLTAYSRDYDSVVNASLAVRRRIIRDTNRTVSRGAPVLTEAGTKYEGEVIVYNFQTKRGTVELATTEMEGGYYYGEKIKQVAPKTLFVQNGRYTTCEQPIPHYYFESPKMKVIMGDMIFAEPVYLYVADVPVFVLPFAVFPDHSGGRHSGIIIPSYQVTGDRGYGLTHLGYYQVFSDYFDAAVRSDIYTKGGYNVDLQTYFMKRYLLSSPASLHVAYGFTRFNSVDPYQKNWLLETILPNLNLGWQTTFNARLSFQSNNYFQNTATSINQYLTQQVNSNASFNTGWEDAGVNLGIDYSRSQDLRFNTYTEESPTINLSKTTFYPFASDESSTPNVLSTLGIGYSMTAKRHVERDSVTTNNVTTWSTREQYGVLHSPTISIAPKLGHFTFSPSFSYSEAWLFKKHFHNYYIAPDSTVQFRDSTANGFYRLSNYNAGVGLSTTLYGIANIGAFGIEAIRHTLIPSISINYHPDLSSQELVPYTDPRTNQLSKYDLFDGELYSGFASGSKSATISMGLGNDFEAKVEQQVTKDSVGESKVKLLHLDASSGYDVIQKTLSQLALSAYSAIGSTLSIHGDASFSFYPLDTNGAELTKQTLISLRQGIVRPLSASVGIDGSFSSTQTTEGANYDSLRRLVHITSPEDERLMLLGGYYPGDYVGVPFRPKWNISYGLSYQQNYLGTQISRDFSVNSAITLSITTNWSVTTSASYDLVAKKILVPEIRVHRDLDCWEMNFAYRPPGSGLPGFNFEIRVKAPQLQDIKLTRTENNYGSGQF